MVGKVEQIHSFFKIILVIKIQYFVPQKRIYWGALHELHSLKNQLL